MLLGDEKIKEKSKLDLNLILNDEKPELIDEWNLIPEVWDAVRRKCDDTIEKENYMLTCSTKLSDEEQKKENTSFRSWQNWKNRNAYDEPI